MSRNTRINLILAAMSAVFGCYSCSTRLRYGDFECPHCGLDQEDHLRAWAKALLDRLDAEGPRDAP